MPTTERAPAVGAPVATVRRHLWLGGGVPKSYPAYDRLRADGFEPGLDVRVSLDPLTVSLTNARAGHLLPTGDPERHLRVVVRAEDAAGATLAREVLRIGQTWDWGDETTGRPARRLEDTRLRAGETRAWQPTLSTAGAARVVVEVAHVRLAPDTARWLSKATLDAELDALGPGVGALLPEVDRHYPLATWVYRETLPLDGGPAVITPLDQLLAESAAAAGQSLEQKAAALGEPSD